MALAEQNFVDTVLEVTRQKMKKIDTGEIQTSITCLAASLLKSCRMAISYDL